MEPAQAAAEAARRKLKRASGLLRDALHELAAIVDGETALGVLRAHDAQSTQQALELIRLGVARHGAVDVIVLARPTGRAHPPRPPDGAKEQPHGPHQDREERTGG